MNIETLLAAVVGAVIGVGSTLITDSVRARREVDQKWADTKRLVYVRFLMAMAQAHSRMKVAALEQLGPAEKRRAVSAAFHDDPQHAEAKAILRELAITAPESVNLLAFETYDCLRAARNVLSMPEYRVASKPFWDKLSMLQDVMRDDLRPGSGHRRNEPTGYKATRPEEEAGQALMAADEP
jgi:hypothetical protein